MTHRVESSFKQERKITQHMASGLERQMRKVTIWFALKHRSPSLSKRALLESASEILRQYQLVNLNISDISEFYLVE